MHDTTEKKTPNHGNAMANVTYTPGICVPSQLATRRATCTGHYRDDSEAWYQVVDESGVELLEAPDAGSTRMLELFLPGKVGFHSCVVLDNCRDIDKHY